MFFWLIVRHLVNVNSAVDFFFDKVNKCLPQIPFGATSVDHQFQLKKCKTMLSLYKLICG